MPLPPTTRLLSTPWFPTPGSVEPGVQLFAIGDVHGRAGALEAALDAIADSPRAAATRRLVFLGDLIDRGPRSLLCLEMARQGEHHAQVDECFVLPGNHEIMMAEALLEPGYMMIPWVEAGGKAVLLETGIDPEAEPDAIAQALQPLLPEGWAQDVLASEGHHRSGDVLCVHAGVHPHIPLDGFLAQAPNAPGLMEHHWAWIREPFLSWTRGWDPAGKTVVVHGHTPAVAGWIGSEQDMAALVPLDRRRVCLDAAAAARAQVAWVEWVGHKARVRCVQHNRGDVF